MYLLDTDVLIDIQRGHGPAVAWFSSLIELPSLPGIVVMVMIVIMIMIAVRRDYVR